MKKAILVVSFGTTHLDTLEKTICAVEKDIAEANPGVPCFRAFTSSIVRKRLKAKGMEVNSVEEALQALRSEEYTNVLVQPTLLLPGEEYDLLRNAVMCEAGDMEVSIGLPLLWDDRDISALAEAMKEAYPLEDDTILLAMGHGTSHSADAVYARLRKAMNQRGMEICTVEGSIDFEFACNALLAQPKRRVHLVPMLLVAGDHSKNDMAGDEEDSLKSILSRAGFEVSYSITGLGEIPAVREMYCKKALKSM